MRCERNGSPLIILPFASMGSCLDHTTSASRSNRSKSRRLNAKGGSQTTDLPRRQLDCALSKPTHIFAPRLMAKYHLRGTGDEMLERHHNTMGIVMTVKDRKDRFTHRESLGAKLEGLGRQVGMSYRC